MCCEKKYIARVISDVFLAMLVGGGCLGIKLGASPYQRGFFCDDESIQHPLKSDRVSLALCVGVGVSVSFIVIFITEICSCCKCLKSCITVKHYRPKDEDSKCFLTYTAVMAFTFGMLATAFLTEVGKFSIGRLRPHFLTLCNPDMSILDCSKGYIVANVCTTNETRMLKEARLSFPSGHSSFSMYCAMYLILYLQARISIPNLRMLKPILQLVFFSLAFFTCLSRVSDYKHHWSDVLAGAVLGIVICVFTVLTFTDFGQILLGRKAHSTEQQTEKQNADQSIESGHGTTMSAPLIQRGDDDVARS